jgi:hypothetical protein
VSLVEKRTVTRFYATRKILGEGGFYSMYRRSFSRAADAFLWVARAALFNARNTRCQCKRIEREYTGSPAWDGGPGQCRYCDQVQWAPIVARLARILRQRDSVATGQP